MPQFAKGNRANPGGRPKGLLTFAKLIREETGNGAELVRIALTVARSEYAKNSDKIRALEYLTDRMFGKAPQTIDLTTVATVTHKRAWDLEALSVDDLRALRALAVRAKRADAETVEVRTLPPEPDDAT